MEWVETTGRTIEEAKSLALDRLGVDESDAEFDILDEPRAGLFGRVRGEARVRARVRPTQARAKVERRDRKKRPDKATSDTDTVDTESSVAVSTAAISNSDAPKASARKPRGARPTGGSDETLPARKTAPRGTDDKETVVDAEQVGQEAQRFVQELVAAFGLEGTTTVQCEGDEIDVRVEGSELGVLVGPRGTTLQAVQELARVAAQRRLGDHDTRLRVDVGGYRERRKEALGRFAHQVAAQVVSEGSAKRLEPMSSSDRKVIHDVLATYEGVVTHSEGEDPRRCVVIAPSND
jgi:spoIIIJ-associated protein